MLKRSRMVVSLLMVLVMFFSLVAAPAFAGTETGGSTEYGAEAMVFDTVFLRPFGLLATVFGSAIFVVSLPFSIPGGNTGVAAKKLVADPFRYTFKRPLGQIEP